MATDLTRIGEKARKEPDLVFTSLYHHITDADNLRACYDTLAPRKAPGVDGVTKDEYGKNLEENLGDLSARLKRMGYRPGPKRRSYIPKPGSEKGRPLGISNLEDIFHVIFTAGCRSFPSATCGTSRPVCAQKCAYSAAVTG